MSSLVHDTSTGGESGATERTSLLDGEGEGTNNYATKGETTVRLDNQESEDEDNSVEPLLEQEAPTSTRRRSDHSSRSGDSDGGGSDGGGSDGEGRRDDSDPVDDIQCGLVYCGKKLLNLLPSIGDDDEDDEDSEANESALRHGAKQIIQLIIPVTMCMAVVLIFQLTIAANEAPTNVQLYYLPFNENNASSSGFTFLFALVNAIVFVAIVLVMTIVLVLLFKYRCYKAIYIWLLVASALLLFVVSSAYFIEILVVRKLVIDWFSFAFFVWNFGVMGLMVIHWKGPLRLQQAYLILTSALVATVLIKYLPNWTTWILLVAISLYDLFAVLCPKGPLRILVETAKERNQPIFPSLIYSSTMVWIVGMADKDDTKNSNNKDKDKKKDRGALPKQRPHKKQRSSSAGSTNSSNTSDSDAETNRQQAAREMVRSQQSPDARHPSIGTDGSPREESTESSRRQEGSDGQEEEEEEPRGFKLGLGDFIFYSILVGKAAHENSGDWVVISSCFVAILIGLCMTSLILGIVRRALPALPISIFFGLIFYFSSRYLISPFVDVLATLQVFI